MVDNAALREAPNQTQHTDLHVYRWLALRLWLNGQASADSTPNQAGGALVRNRASPRPSWLR